ncbi:MAG: transposase, partial [Actinomycetota bacterium]
MSGPNRGTIYAGIYHVWRRTAGPVAMFKDDVDRTDFCNRLADTSTRYGWRCAAFVLMPTHFHLMLDLPENALQNGMHRLFGMYAQQFNRRWNRSGHLRAGPYKCRLIEGETDLLG